MKYWGKEKRYNNFFFKFMVWVVIIFIIFLIINIKIMEILIPIITK